MIRFGLISRRGGGCINLAEYTPMSSDHFSKSHLLPVRVSLQLAKKSKFLHPSCYQALAGLGWYKHIWMLLLEEAAAVKDALMTLLGIMKGFFDLKISFFCHYSCPSRTQGELVYNLTLNLKGRAS